MRMGNNNSNEIPQVKRDKASVARDDTSCAAKLEKFRALESQQGELVESLVDELSEQREHVEKLQTDLENARVECSKAQKKSVALMKSAPQGHSSDYKFAAVLLDADADDYIFQRKYLDLGEEGGKQAADEIFVQAQSYLSQYNSVSSANVVVHAFANLSGLQKACVEHGNMRQGADMYAFARGFNQRKGLFNFVDVGGGKEKADHKIRENLTALLSNVQCAHIILGLCHDTGYLPCLDDIASEPQNRERVTLVGSRMMDQKRWTVGLKTPVLYWTSIFTPLLKGEKSYAAAAAADVNGRKMEKDVSSRLESEVQESMTAHVTDEHTILPTSVRHVNPAGCSERLQLHTDEQGNRVDIPLNIDPQSRYLNVLREKQFCGWYYLRGSCQGSCSKKHVPGLIRTPHEIDCVWFLMRQAECYKSRKGKFCEDALCIYGHHYVGQNK